MILDKLGQASRYESMHPLFAQAFAVLRSTDWAAEPAGRRELVPGRLMAIVADGEGRGPARARLETHEQFIDIQYVVAGEDSIGWSHISDAGLSAESYSAEKDIAFFKGAPRAWITVPPGHFAIFFPEDAHAPLAGHGSLRKVVVKAAVAG